MVSGTNVPWYSSSLCRLLESHTHTDRKTLQGKKEVVRNQTARTKQSGCL